MGTPFRTNQFSHPVDGTATTTATHCIVQVVRSRFHVLIMRRYSFFLPFFLSCSLAFRITTCEPADWFLCSMSRFLISMKRGIKTVFNFYVFLSSFLRTRFSLCVSVCQKTFKCFYATLKFWHALEGVRRSTVELEGDAQDAFYSWKPKVKNPLHGTVNRQ